jgi:hypothetical protein
MVQLIGSLFILLQYSYQKLQKGSIEIYNSDTVDVRSRAGGRFGGWQEFNGDLTVETPHRRIGRGPLIY